MKKSVVFLTFLALTGFSKAQDYYHGVGAQLDFGIFKTETGLVTSSGGVLLPGVFYKGSLAFEINRDMNFALSFYPLIGMMGTFNSQSGGSSNLAFGVELPIVGEVYFGDVDDMCFFVGAGVSAALLANADAGGAIVGPHIDLGGQFEFRDNLIGLKAAFTYGLNNAGYVAPTKYTNNLFSVGAYYVLGR